MSSIAPSIDTTSHSPVMMMDESFVKFVMEPTPQVTAAADGMLLAVARRLIDKELEVVTSMAHDLRAHPEEFIRRIHPYIAWRPPLDGTLVMTLAMRVESILVPRLLANLGGSSLRFRTQGVPDDLAVCVTYFRRRNSIQHHHLSFAARALLEMRHFPTDADDIWFFLTSVALPILYRLAVCSPRDDDAMCNELFHLCLAVTKQLKTPGVWLVTVAAEHAPILIQALVTTIIPARARGTVESFADPAIDAAWRRACLPDTVPLFRRPPMNKDEPATDETGD